MAVALFGGEGGIRTLGTVAGTAVFKTATFNHSVTSPDKIVYHVEKRYCIPVYN